MINDANPGLIAVMGLSTIELIKLWQSVAPSLEEVRAAQPGDEIIAQRMLDANWLGAGLAVLIGGTTSILLKSWLPVMLSVGSVALFSEWHRQVMFSTAITKE